MLSTQSARRFPLTRLTFSILVSIFVSSAAQAITFKPPEDGAPKDASSASSRGGESCRNLHSKESLLSSVVPLIPQSRSGTTLEERPTILLYVSQPGTQQALFSVKTSDQMTHYEMLIPLAEEARIIAIKLPADAPALEIGENYKWYFSLECEGIWRPAYPIQGKIKRIVPPSSFTALSEKDSIDTAASFGQAGIWYDTAVKMFQIHSQDPTNNETKRHWEELLNSVELTQLTDLNTAIAP